MSEEWACPDCDYENEADQQVCESCDAPKPEDPRYAGYKVGLVVECEDIPKSQKLKQLKVDIGEDEPVQIVTNAPNAKVGLRTCIATVGAKVEMEGEEVEVKKSMVGGRASLGMVCNGPMLSWTGGDNKAAVTIPESFAVGSAPPASRPRGDK